MKARLFSVVLLACVLFSCGQVIPAQVEFELKQDKELVGPIRPKAEKVGSERQFVLPTGEVGTVDLNIKDPFVQKTFKELVQKKQAEKVPFILARVVSLDNRGDFHVSYYESLGWDAYDILFIEKEPSKKLDKVTKNAVVQHVLYFTLDDLDQKKLLYLGSDYDFTNTDSMRNELMGASMLASYLTNSKRRAEAKYDLAGVYVAGKWLKDPDMKRIYQQKAFKLYESVAQQGDFLVTRALAQHRLAWMYHRGVGVEQSYDKADHFYDKAERFYTQAKDPELSDEDYQAITTDLQAIKAARKEIHAELKKEQENASEPQAAGELFEI